MADKILIVDDQEPILELLSTYLTEAGFEVEAAQSGMEAMLKFVKGGWAVVVTDRMMPGMSGDELAAIIRRLSPEVPLVLVTGYTEPSMGNFEFDAMVSKPFDQQTLLNAVRSVLRPVKDRSL